MLKLIHKALTGFLLTTSVYALDTSSVDISLSTNSISNTQNKKNLEELLKEHTEQVRKLVQKKSNIVDPDEVYQVMLIEMALIDEDYDEYVRLVSRFSKQHRLYPEYIKIALMSLPMTSRTEEILEPAKKLYKLEPDSKPLQALMGLLFSISGRYDDLEEILIKNIIFKKNMSDEEIDQILESLSGILKIMPEQTKALEIYQKYTQDLIHKTPMYWRYLAEFSLTAKNYAKAWDAALKHFDTAQDRSEAIEIIYAFLALPEYRQRAYEKIRFYNLMSENPLYENTELAMLLHSDEKSRPLAHDFAKWLRKTYPDVPQYILVDALMSYIEYDDTSALRYVDEYMGIATQKLKDDPANDSLLSSMDRAILIKLDILIREPNNKDFKEILRLLAELPEDKYEFKYYIAKSEALMHTWRVPEGLALLQDTIIRFPEYAQPAISYGTRTLIDVGRTQMALDLVKPYYEANPKSGVYSELTAWAYQASGNTKKAEEVYRLCLKHNPDNVPCLNGLGYMFADLNYNLDESLDLLRTASSLEPNSPYIKDSLGWIYYKLGMADMALMYISDSYSDVPMAETAAHLVEIYYVMGDINRAKQVAKEGLKLYQYNDYLPNTLRKLKLDLNQGSHENH